MCAMDMGSAIYSGLLIQIVANGKYANSNPPFDGIERGILVRAVFPWTAPRKVRHICRYLI